jgi:hypothetical protein
MDVGMHGFVYAWMRVWLRSCSLASVLGAEVSIRARVVSDDVGKRVRVLVRV